MIRIQNISRHIKYVYSKDLQGDWISSWSDKQMKIAAENFSLLSTWVLFPQAETIQNLKNRICFYINIFLTGNLHELPREETMGDHIKIFGSLKYEFLRKFVNFLLLCLYMLFPLFIIFLLTNFVKIEINPLIQSTLYALYIVWIFLGLFTFAEKVNPDIKSFLVDLFKNIGGK